MRRVLTIFTAALMSAAMPAAAMENGDYRGEAGPDGEINISVRNQRFRIEVQVTGCQGDTEGILRPAGKDRWRVIPSDADAGNQCVIGVRRAGNGFEITEKDCMFYHGLSCSFDGEVTARGAAGGPAAGRSAGAGGAGPANGSVWTYGVHPVLGKSAHVETPDGAIGLACAYFGDSWAMTEILSFRATSNLARQGTLSVMFDNGLGGSMPMREGRGFVERRDTTCAVPLESLKRASVLYVLDEARVEGFDSSSGELVITVNENGRKIEFTSRNVAELETLKAIRFPLTGSTRAINRMISECRAAQRDIEAMCGAE